MSENVTALRPAAQAPIGLRVQAFFSSLVVTAGAFVAGLVVLSALAVSLPLMLAASLTLEPKGRRRGWHELELARA